MKKNLREKYEIEEEDNFFILIDQAHNRLEKILDTFDKRAKQINILVIFCLIIIFILMLFGFRMKK